MGNLIVARPMNHAPAMRWMKIHINISLHGTLYSLIIIDPSPFLIKNSITISPIRDPKTQYTIIYSIYIIYPDIIIHIYIQSYIRSITEALRFVNPIHYGAPDVQLPMHAWASSCNKWPCIVLKKKQSTLKRSNIKKTVKDLYDCMTV